MKHGHVTGHKKERSGKGSNWWYQTPEAEAIIRKLEAEWEAKQQQASTQGWMAEERKAPQPSLDHL